MWYVYVLESRRDSRLYTGCTGDLKKRIQEHNVGRVVATKNRRPLILVYYEAFLNRSDAFAREQWLKAGWGRTHLQKILANYLKN